MCHRPPVTSQAHIRDITNSVRELMRMAMHVLVSVSIDDGFVFEGPSRCEAYRSGPGRVSYYAKYGTKSSDAWCRAACVDEALWKDGLCRSYAYRSSDGSCLLYMQGNGRIPENAKFGWRLGQSRAGTKDTSYECYTHTDSDSTYNKCKGISFAAQTRLDGPQGLLH